MNGGVWFSSTWAPASGAEIDKNGDVQRTGTIR